MATTDDCRPRTPLHTVLDTALVAHGVLLLVGVALLATVLPAGTRASRRAAVAAVAAATPATAGVVPHGLVERTAACTGIAWQLLTATHLLTRRP